MLSMCHCWKVGQVFIVAVWLQVRYHSTFDLLFFITCPCFRYIIGGSCHEYHFCSNKHVFVAQTCVCHDKCFVMKCVLLSQQKFCCNRIMFVTTNCCNKHVFVMTHILLSQQKMFCRSKHVFVVTKMCLLQKNFCCEKNMFVMTKVLSRQT